MSKTVDRYLYAIHALKKKYECVRAVDVAHFLNLSKASVSIAVRQMREQGLLETEPDGNLLFTERGKSQSDHLGCRVHFFEHLLAAAGVEPSQALRDAISFSWEMSDASFEAFRTMYADSMKASEQRQE
ncbi:MAG: metal-dependent transcriptional regulator [Clostridiales bacterium]|nr:MarR family transcriptional regulator [Clostridia bacterium]MCR4884384.1 metal-dependent transcriptional regulator [Clostridiales bacterium]